MNRASITLTPLQGWVFELIEKSGDNGRRTCELCEKTKRGNGAIVNVLRCLRDAGLIIKIVGDPVVEIRIPRYVHQ